MTLDTLIMGTGALIAFFAVLPRFPERFDIALFFTLGVIVIALGIVVRRRAARSAVIKDVHMSASSPAPVVADVVNMTAAEVQA